MKKDPKTKAKVVNKALISHRNKIKRSGQRRVELRAKANDVALLRSVAEALMDPVREAEARALLRRHFARLSSAEIKAYLAAAPLEGIDLTRQRDLPRDVDL